MAQAVRVVGIVLEMGKSFAIWIIAIKSFIRSNPEVSILVLINCLYTIPVQTVRIVVILMIVGEARCSLYKSLQSFFSEGGSFWTNSTKNRCRL